MAAAEQHLSRRAFFVAIVAAPAVLAACSQQPIEPAIAPPGPTAPAATAPRVHEAPPFTALRLVPLDRAVEPAFAFHPAVARRRP